MRRGDRERGRDIGGNECKEIHRGIGREGGEEEERGRERERERDK